MIIGSTLLVALGAMACGDPDESVGVHAPDRSGPPSTQRSEAQPDTPPPTDADPPLRRPKPGVRLSVTPPPIKPP
ncbi:MAG TPA: hypothetical protein VKD21_07970 [Acidimicrobiales bacterium]|nr:hypothetical protein [Acidimicrobiales bacterium]